jgi:hypothetical protein
MGALAILLACAVAGTLLIQIGTASAASRGFFIYNHSKHALRLERVASLLFYRAKYGCDNDICRRGGHLGFEGHPHPGAVLEPDAAPHDFELKYHVYHAPRQVLVRGILGVQDRGDGLDVRGPNRDLHVLKQLLLQGDPRASPSVLALPGRAIRGRPQDHVWRPLDSAGARLRDRSRARAC